MPFLQRRAAFLPYSAGGVHRVVGCVLLKNSMNEVDFLESTPLEGTLLIN